MRALVIAPQPFFSPRGTPFSVYYRTMVEANLGCKIDLLTYGEGENVQIPGVRIIRIPRMAFLGDVKIGPSPLKFFLDMILTVWAVSLLTFKRYDFVHAHEEAIFICIFLKPIFRFKLIYDMHSSLPQQLENFNFSRSRILKKLFQWFENKSLRSADAIITICPDLADYALRLMPDKKHHFLIENSIFDPVRLASKKENNNQVIQNQAVQKAATFLKKYPCVVYAGTLEPYQGIDLLLEAFVEVLSAQPRTGLLILGGSTDQVSRYKNKVIQLGMNGQVFLTGRVSPDIARNLIRSAAVLVSPRCHGTNTPLKVYEQLASGLPLVATKIYSHTQVLSEHVAILVEPEVKDLSQGILKALNPDGEVYALAQNAKKLYQEKYSRSAYETKMKNLLELVV
jgi:glycosyltransferase involved in cell wall biosynthesis